MMKRLIPRSKKAVMAWDTIIIVVILSVFALIFIIAVFGPTGLIQKVREMSESVFGSVPKAPDKAAPPGELPVAPPELRGAFNRLIVALDKDVNGPCIIDWKDTSEKDKGNHLPSDFAGFTISFRKADDGFYASLSKDNVEVDSTTISKGLCVVAGKIHGTDITVKKMLGGQAVINLEEEKPADGNPFVGTDGDFREFQADFPDYTDKSQLRVAAQNFYTNWIFDFGEKLNYASMRRNGEKIISPDYTNIYQIEITDKDTMVVRYEDESENKWGKEDGGLLYVPEKGKVCLFSTIDDFTGDCEAHEEGIESDCLDTQEEIVTLIKNVGLCSQK